MTDRVLPSGVAVAVGRLAPEEVAALDYFEAGHTFAETAAQMGWDM
jgi:hypothetical protein